MTCVDDLGDLEAMDYDKCDMCARRGESEMCEQCRRIVLPDMDEVLYGGEGRLSAWLALDWDGIVDAYENSND